MQPENQQWAILFYLTDDGTLLRHISQNLPFSNATILIQQNRNASAERYIFSPGQSDSTPAKISITAPTDPIMLADFLQWASDSVPAAHTALAMQFSHITGFNAATETPASALEIPQLQQILGQHLRAGFHQVDLLFFLSPASQFIEIGYQFANTADVLLGLQTGTALPVDAFTTVVAAWKTLFTTPQPISATTLAVAAVNATPNLAAMNLHNLNTIARAFDSLTMALLQSLGDDIVWRVMWHAESGTLFPGLPPVAKLAAGNIDLCGWLEFLADKLSRSAKMAIPRWFVKKLKRSSGATRTELRNIGKRSTDPASLEHAITEALEELPEWVANDFRIIQSQRHRAATLADMATRIIFLLKESDGVLTGSFTERAAYGGISIYLPQNIDRLTESDYLSLEFSRYTHWTSLLGGINLIAAHPRALWRLSSSLLTTANSRVREDLLRRLIGPESVMVGFREQFRALANPAKLTLTLEPLAADGSDTADTFRLRLESPETGATVLEQKSRVNPQTIESALKGLQDLLARGWVNSHRMAQLESLGRTLGEDIIQDLADSLNEEYRRLAWMSSAGAAPHLQLQMPRHLMRYPWELLHDGAGLLLDRYALGRQVFMERPPARPAHLRPSGGLRVLVIGDPVLEADIAEKWPQLPGAREEAEQVARVFTDGQSIFGSAVNFRRERDAYIHTAITRLDFRQLLRSGEYDIIHFAGHAIFNPENPEQSAWLFSDGALWAQEIHNTLEHAPRAPWLVYANACEAAMEDSARTSRYQGDVFGLATAFINQGVAAYIAPLWRINDSVAAQMAIDFYHALLMESASLGEALRFARLEARRDGTGEEKNFTGAPPLPAQIGLGWASFVLYGDPAARPLNSLWTPHHLDSATISDAIPARVTVPHRPKMKRPQHLLQASVEETLALCTGPGMTPLSPDTFRGQAISSENDTVLELMEVNGIRCWQTRDPNTGNPVPLSGSTLPQLRQLPAVQQVLGRERGFAGYVRTIGRWLFKRDEGDMLAQLGQRYDENLVPTEKFYIVNPDTSLADPGPAPWWWVDGNTASETDRVLLLLHGTFSKSKYPALGLGAEFLQWASRYYRGVIAYDHWTVSKSPLDNARELWAMLDDRLRRGNRRVDIIAHSRGGLVARALVELEGHHGAVNRVVFVATPNSGSNWVNPANWANTADHLVNMLHLDNFGLYGQLSAFFARLLISGKGSEELMAAINRHLPGFEAQNPLVTGPDDFLGKLQQGEGPPPPVKYAAIAANYEPPDAQLSLGAIVRRVVQHTSDAVSDNFLAEFNDLVVDTPRVWAVDTRQNEPTNTTMPWLPGSAMLVYNPKQRMHLPSGAMSLNVSGVHHSNILYYRQSRNFLRDQLTRPLD